MNLDNTYITLMGYTIFEPMTIVTNLVFFVLCLTYFFRLRSFSHIYATQMARFILMMGVSSFFGAIAHGVHEQLGKTFFNSMFFLMNALSIGSIYFCFRAPYTYYTLDKSPSNFIITVVLAWVFSLLVLSFVKGNFLLIKIHAGITLTYSLAVHSLAYIRKREKGSALIVAGIVVAFLSIVAHTLRISFHEWFNYKDLAHVIMIISLVIIYKGIKLNVVQLQSPVANLAAVSA